MVHLVSFFTEKLVVSFEMAKKWWLTGEHFQRGRKLGKKKIHKLHSYDEQIDLFLVLVSYNVHINIITRRTSELFTQNKFDEKHVKNIFIRI